MVASRVGDVIASKYRLEALLGSGGMGHVYRAVNMRAGRAVAIKILRLEHATNAPIVERFLREALAANLVRHPNVVDVIDVDKDEDGAPFIVQELLEGVDLAKYVETHGGKLTLAEVESFLLPVIDAVAEAHARGVVHRDIKPENVFLARNTGPKGTVTVPKLLDFGISKVRLPDIKATEVGVMMGTPAYMSPEQVQGSRDADPRTDVWALGIMLFEVLSGRLPYDAADAPALFVAIATKDAERLSDVTPDLDPNVSRVVERCLRRNPEQRYPSALELARDMRHVLAGIDPEPTLTRSIPPAAMRGGPTFKIPDLGLPKETDAFELKRPAAAATIREEPKAFASTEIAPKRGYTEPLPPVPDLVPDLVAPAPKAAPSSARMQQTTPLTPAPKPERPKEPSAPVLAPPSANRLHAAAPMQGVMLAGESVSTQRRQPYHAQVAEPPPPPADTGFIVGIGVVGLVALGVTGGLSAAVNLPAGFSLLAQVMKPVPSEANAVVQIVLALAGIGAAIKLGSGGVKRWNGDLPGGRGSALGVALVAGAVLFAAVQLGRAAW